VKPDGDEIQRLHVGLSALRALTSSVRQGA
jgi:hypothetical protein